jgi:phosphoserine phosphatase
MTHVLTFVASDYSLLDLMRATHRVLGEQRARIERIDWLDPGRACDVFFAEADPALVEAAVRSAVGAATVDLAVQPAAGRRKKLLVADMESTVIQNEMLEELADFVGLRAQVERITTRAMNGELDFRAALIERVALLRGLPAQVLTDCREVIRFDPGARVLVETLRAHGAYCALVTGGFTCFADWVAERVGFDSSQANLLEVADGKLSGEVAEPILGKEAKLAALETLAAERGLTPADAVTVGDGANDLPMLAAAGLGVAFHGKPTVAAAARFRIDHGDLRALLYFQGYRRSELCGEARTR